MHLLTTRFQPGHAVRLLLAALLLASTFTFLAPCPAHAATSYRVVMSNYAFSPRSLTITAGDTVTWVNQDQAPHDVKTTSGPESIHSPLLSKGGSWSHTFTTPGSYGYVCTVHPGMSAQLVVKAAAPTPTTHPTVQQHAGSTPSAAQPAQSAPAVGPTAHAGHSASAAPPAPGSPSASAAVAAAAAAPTQQAAAPADSTTSAARPLDPLLLLAGIVAGVAVLCLLLVGSRSAAAGARRDTASPS
ncbi:plastocyanin/azurin family copper-binding protein [Streptomyces sp. NPDC001315]|uniref:cupredoxin domain-containing protein n=1 Tax=Streptomyces sp. NPDC001315 TaxID=3364562 RepID=UPI0036B5F2DD